MRKEFALMTGVLLILVVLLFAWTWGWERKKEVIRGGVIKQVEFMEDPPFYGKTKCFSCLRETGGLPAERTQGTKCNDCLN